MEDSLHIHTKYFDFIGFFHIKARVKEVPKRKKKWNAFNMKFMRVKK